jgi:hypothetical protein
VLILGVSPLIPLDASYRDFLLLVAAQTETALAGAQSSALGLPVTFKSIQPV